MKRRQTTDRDGCVYDEEVQEENHDRIEEGLIYCEDVCSLGIGCRNQNIDKVGGSYETENK